MSYLPLRKALLTIFLSVLLISGTAWISFAVYKTFLQARAFDPKYDVVALVQTGPELAPLKTSLIAELLLLSVDRPTNLYKMDLAAARNKLLAFPLIKEAQVKRIPPGTVYIDYTVRRPIAFLADLKNAAIDQDLVLFPFSPFFSPKKLPELILGVDSSTLSWGDKIKSPNARLAISLLDQIPKEISALKVDLSRSEALSLGEEQVILVLEERQEEAPFFLKRTLLLKPSELQDGLKRYFALRKHIVLLKDPHPLIIDLRLKGLGLIKQEPI